MKTWERHQQIRAKKSKYPSPESGKVVPDSTCKQMMADDSKCPRNPIQSESESESNTNDCTAASAAPVATLTLVDGSIYEITQEDAGKDSQAYPAVDVLTEYLKMERWLAANPKNRKTRSGIRRFINSWLGRAQNSARTGAGAKVVSAQQYQQRNYTESELDSVTAEMIAEAKRMVDTA
jgi:hypothetical protein